MTLQATDDDGDLLLPDFLRMFEQESQKSLSLCTFPNCPFVFSTVELQQKHNRRHTHNKPYPCMYEDCPKCFSRKTSRERTIYIYIFSCIADVYE